MAKRKPDLVTDSAPGLLIIGAVCRDVSTRVAHLHTSIIRIGIFTVKESS